MGLGGVAVATANSAVLVSRPPGGPPRTPRSDDARDCERLGPKTRSAPTRDLQFRSSVDRFLRSVKRGSNSFRWPLGARAFRAQAPRGSAGAVFL